jgi:hypothetical protein
MSPPQMLQTCSINSCVGRQFGLYFYTIKVSVFAVLVERPEYKSGGGEFKEPR